MSFPTRRTSRWPRRHGVIAGPRLEVSDHHVVQPVHGSCRGLTGGLLGLLMLGCSSPPPGDPIDASSTQPASSTGALSLPPIGSTGSSTSGPPDTGNVELTTTTGGIGEGAECDPYAQDCMEGLKCVPRLADGIDIVNACVVVTGSDTPGDPCTHEGVLSGEDSCDAEGMCFGELNFITGWEGVCRRFCEGTPEVAECESLDAQCAGGLFPACLPRCDPLVQDCTGPSEGCYFRGAIDSFVCFVSASSAGAGDNCETGTSCSPGLQCRAAETVAGCTTTNCCAEFCDTEEVGACDGAVAGADCITLGATEPQFENVGVCGLPQ